MARRRTKTIFIFNTMVALSPLKRKSIYGERKLVAKTGSGRECAKAYLSEAGTEIFPKGATSICKIDSNGNAYEEKNEPQDYAPEFQYRENVDRNDMYRITKDELTVDFMNTFCGHITAIYTLEDFDQAELIEILGDKIYFYKLPDGKGYCKNSLVFQRKGKIFLLVYEPGRVENVKRDEPTQIDDIPLVADLDSIDFEMFQ